MPSAVSPAPKIMRIDTFPAVQTATDFGDPQHECLLFVDLAQGQSLQVQYLNQSGVYPGINHAVDCQLAATAATEMVITLRTLVHGRVRSSTTAERSATYVAGSATNRERSRSEARRPGPLCAVSSTLSAVTRLTAG